MKGTDSLELSNIKDGMIIKNYKELCKLLNEKEKTGKSKQLQLKEWKRYFDYDKHGQNFIINIIYDEPLNNNQKNIYIKHIEYILLNYIYQQKGYKIQTTLNKLLPEFNFISDNYFIISDKELKKRLNCENSNWYINHYKYRVEKKIKETFNSALNSLKNRRLIEYQWVYMIKRIYKIDDIQELIIDIHEADEIEINIIKDIEKEVLEDMNYYNINLVFKYGRKYEFYSKVNKLLKERYDIDQCWQEIKILFTKEYIENGLKETDKQIDYLRKKETHKRMLNDKFTNAIDKQAEYYYNKYKVKYFGELNRMDKKYLYNSKNYLYSQRKLNEWIGKLNNNISNIENIYKANSKKEEKLN